MVKNPMASNPVLVEIVRGSLVESESRGGVVIMDAHGKTIFSLGDTSRDVFPRSAWKPLQAIAVVSSGAADRYLLSTAELALACASHYGEAIHTRCVARWLRRLAISPASLKCGTQLSVYGLDIRTMQLRFRKSPTPIHNNCSGKHAAFLTLAKYRGSKRSDYLHPAALVQQEIAECLSEVCQFDVRSRDVAIDGCAAPTYAVPINHLALGFARFSEPRVLRGTYRDAALRLHAAISSNPILFSGTRTFPSMIVARARGAVIVKPGAEGTYGLFIRELGWGIAIKVDDGALRTAECVAGAILTELFHRRSELKSIAASVARSRVKGSARQITGEIRPTIQLTESLKRFRGAASK